MKKTMPPYRFVFQWDIGQNALEWLPQFQIMLVEKAGGDAPFLQKLFFPFVLAHALGGFRAEMIDEAAAHALEVTDSHLPQLARQVGVGIHAGRELHAHAAHKVPRVSRHQTGRPASSGPVAFHEIRTSREQLILAEGFQTRAKIAYHAARIASRRLDHRSGKHEVRIRNLLHFRVQGLVPSGKEIHVVVGVNHVRRTHHAAAGVQSQADADIAFRNDVVHVLLGVQPLRSPVGSLVHQHYNLVVEGGILADASQTKLKVRKIVP